MSTCEHGYTAFYDCPYCLCPGCEAAMENCTCNAEPASVPAPAAPESVEDLELVVRAAGEVA